MRSLIVAFSLLVTACGSVAGSEDASNGIDGGETWTLAGQLDGVILSQWFHVVGVGTRVYVGREDGTPANRYFRWLDVTTGAVGTEVADPSLDAAGYNGELIPVTQFAQPRIYFFADDGNYFDLSTNAWSTCNYPPAVQRGEAAAAELGGQIYLIGGRSSSDTTDVQIYDPANDLWTSTTPYPFAQSFAIAVTAAGSLYVIGGETNVGTSREVHSFDPLAPAAWTEHPDAPDELSDGEAVVFAGKLRVRNRDTFYTFDPITDAWAAMSVSLPVIGQGNGAIAVAADQLYAVIEDLTSVKIYRYNGS